MGPDWARWGIGRTAAAMVPPRGAAAPGDQWFSTSARRRWLLRFTGVGVVAGSTAGSFQGLRAVALATVAAEMPLASRLVSYLTLAIARSHSQKRARCGGAAPFLGRVEQ